MGLTPIEMDIYLPDKNSQNAQMISEELSFTNCSYEIKEIHSWQNSMALTQPTLILSECSKFTLTGEVNVKFSVGNRSPPTLCRAVDTIPDASSVLYACMISSYSVLLFFLTYSCLVDHLEISSPRYSRGRQLTSLSHLHCHFC